MGPFTGMVLADLGCDVVRVDPGLKSGKTKPQTQWIDSLCRRKSSIIIDFSIPESHDAFLRLLNVADVLIDPQRPGTLDRMIKMSTEELSRRYLRLIYARVTGYSSHDKRYARAIGHENNFMAVSGALPALQHVMSGESTRSQESKSTKMSLSKPTVNYLADFGGGSMACVIGVLAALIDRGVSGKGQIVDASVQQGTTYMATFPLQRRYGQSDREPSLAGVQKAPWSDIYRTADGKYMLVSSIEDVFYNRLLCGLAIESSIMPSRRDRSKWQEIRQILADRFASQSQQHWRSVFDQVQACVSPVLDVDDVDVHQPLVHLSRTPSLPVALKVGSMSKTKGTAEAASDHLSKLPELIPGKENDEVVRRWLGRTDVGTSVGGSLQVLSRARL